MFKTQHLYQNDNKWKNLRLGDSTETIGAWGGLLTSITMMLNGMGYTETPVTVNEKLKKADGFLKALPGPTDVALVWPNCSYCGMTPSETSAVSIAEIDAAVADGEPVILQVHAKQQTGMKTHFVLVKDKKGDDYVLYDPYRDLADRPEKEVLLTKRYGDTAKLESAITAVLWFRRLSPELPMRSRVARFAIPPDKFKLFVTKENVILHDRPAATSFPWKRMKKWTDLICLESKAIGKAKLDKARNGAPDQWILVQDPDGEQGYVSALSVTADLPRLNLPSQDVALSLKKWCLKNVSIQNPEFWDADGKPLQEYTPPKSFSLLRKNTVVSVLKSNETVPGWVRILYLESHYEKSKKKWVTTRVTGWVKDADLDDYREPEKEELRNFVVKIDRQTESTTDAQQYFYIDEGKKLVRFNMCGELCVAAILGKHIDTVLNNWRDDTRSKATYEKMVGKSDQPLGRNEIESLFNVHGVLFERYKLDEKGDAREKYIHLADPEGDGRLAHEELEKQLQDYYFITNLRINTHTGDLVPAYSAEERNHWVVLDRVTRNRTRVELYNPYPNRLEEYTFGELYRAIGGDPNTGWWIKKDTYPALARHAMRQASEASTASAMGGTKTTSRRAPHSLLPSEKLVQPPTFKVAIDNQTVKPDDAEQFLLIRGEGNQAKTNLCGELSVAFILGQSLNTALDHWLDKQEKLKKQGKQPMLWELATLLQAYGFNRKKYLAPEKDSLRESGKYYVKPNIKAPQEGYFKSFSIDTVLEYWKGVQPDLYNSLLGGGRNEPTGPEDLITILKAYGYDKEDYSYYRPGSKEVFGYAPGRDAEVIGKTHYLLAGVNIHKRTGRLQPSGVAHWVVVTRITPRGNLVGGNGGWVELYNPFPNCWEEYSYREFMDAFRGMSEGTTLWIKKDISPDFTWQTLAPAKSKQKVLKSSGKGKGNKNSKSNQQSDKKRKGEKEKQKGKKGARLQVQEFGNEPPLDANQLACERLGVDAIPWEVGKWIRENSNGDKFFAEELADALLECGILSVQDEIINEKKICIAALTDLVFSNKLDAAIKNSMDSLASIPQDPAFRVGGAVLPLFMPRVIEEIKEIRKAMPFHAHQPRHEFRAWTSGIASNFSDPLEAEIRERLESLSMPAQAKRELFPICKIILTRSTSSVLEDEVKKIHSNPAIIDHLMKRWNRKSQETISLSEVKEWIHGLMYKPRKNVYRVKTWGEPGMSELGFDVTGLRARGESSNFQAVGLYNTATGFGAVSNYLIIPRDDVLKLEALQVEDRYEQKREGWLRQKMNWLCQYRGSIYMFAEEDNYRGDWPWRRAEGIRWGTLALGGNLVQVTGRDKFQVKLPGEEKDGGEGVEVEMARLQGFKPDDWDRPLDELLAEGLVHRCFGVFGGNDLGDSPQGIVYSPFWSPEDWEFKPKTKGVPTPTALWIPVAYLAQEPEEIAFSPQGN